MLGIWARRCALRPKTRLLQPLTFSASLRRPANTNIPEQIYKPAIKLRDYQEDCINSVLKYVRNGERRLGVSLATGSGKTVIFTSLISQVPPPTLEATQTLILAHRRELILQAYNQCLVTYPDKTIDIELDRSHASGLADITVASIHSIMSGERKDKFDPKRYKLVLIDEAHHAVAPQYLELLNHFGLRNKLQTEAAADTAPQPGPVLLGVSATFSRFDGLGLGSVIDHIVYHRDYIDMIREKWLCPVKFTTVKWTEVNLNDVPETSTGDFNKRKLAAAVNTLANNQALLSAYLDRCASDRKSTLIFCVDIAHVTDLEATFRAAGIDAKSVTSRTKRRERSETIEAFKQGSFPVLLNCGVYTEGTDIPNVDCVILARPTKSRNLLVQMIGRGMRTSVATGKQDCHVLDMVSALARGVECVPTLVGLEPDTLVENASLEDLEGIKAKLVRERELDTQERSKGQYGGDLELRYTDYDTVSDLIGDAVPLHHIRQVSRLAWVCTRRGTVYGDYVLGGGTSQARVRIIELSSSADADLESQRATYEISYNAGSFPSSDPNRKLAFRKNKVIATAHNFEAAVRAADTFAKSKFELRSIDLYAPWRLQPASEKQLALVRKRYGDTFDVDAEAGITKGQAGDLIMKSVFGAKGYLSKKVKEAEKREKIGMKEERRREREVVRVGPLPVDD